MGRPRGSKNRTTKNVEVSSVQLDGDFDSVSSGKWQSPDDDGEEIPYDEDIQHAVDCMDPKECDCGSDD